MWRHAKAWIRSMEEYLDAQEGAQEGAWFGLGEGSMNCVEYIVNLMPFP